MNISPKEFNMHEALLIAKRAGWRKYYPPEDPTEFVSSGDAIHDPKFWKALGLACGWIDANGNSYAKYINNDPKHTKREMWLWVALKFLEIALTESWNAATEYLAREMDWSPEKVYIEDHTE